MSRRQCCVWGCHNRKGRCAEDIAENRLCGCPVLLGKGCPKPDLLTLHYIESMPEHVKRAVIEKVNITRQGPNRTKWKPTKETVICNMHYLHFKGPSRPDNDVIPIYFKRPRSNPATNYVPKKRRLLQRATREAENLRTRSTDDSQTEQQYLQQYTEGHDDSQAEQDSQQYIEGHDDLQAGQDSQQYTDGHDDLQAGQDSQQYTEGHNDSQAGQDSQQYTEGHDDSQAEQDSQQYTEEHDDLQAGQDSQQYTDGHDDLQAGQDSQQYTEGHNDSQAGQDSQQYTEEQDDSQTEQDSQRYIEGQDDSQAGQKHSHHVEQDNSTVEAYERPESQATLTAAVHPVTLNSMEDLQQENQELHLEILKLKQTIEFLKTNVQRLNLSLLNDSQVQMYTGISRKLFECIIHWFQPVSTQKELSPSQKLLLVLMRLRHNLCQNDLACRFNIQQSSVSRILNNWIPLLGAQLKRLI